MGEQSFLISRFGHIKSAISSDHALLTQGWSDLAIEGIQASPGFCRHGAFAENTIQSAFLSLFTALDTAAAGIVQGTEQTGDGTVC